MTVLQRSKRLVICIYPLASNRRSRSVERMWKTEIEETYWGLEANIKNYTEIECGPMDWSWHGAGAPMNIIMNFVFHKKGNFLSSSAIINLKEQFFSIKSIVNDAHSKLCQTQRMPAVNGLFERGMRVWDCRRPFVLYFLHTDN